MTFINLPIPDDILFGARGGPAFKNLITATASDREKRLPLVTVAKWKWDLAHGVKTQAQFDDLQAHFLIMGGMENSWPLKDHTNFRIGSTSPDAPQDLHVAQSGDDFVPVVRRHSFGGFTYDQRVYLLDAGFRVFLDSVEIFSGFTVDLDDGFITFDSGLGAGEVVGGIGTFKLLVRYDTDDMSISHESYNNFDWPSIPVVAIRPEDR